MATKVQTPGTGCPKGKALTANAQIRICHPGRGRIPGSSESLPVIGFGSSKVVEEIAKNGEDPLRQVLRTLVAHPRSLIFINTPA